MKYTVRYGILLGIISIFVVLVCYLIDYELLVYQADILLFFVTFLLLVHAGLQLRKKRHGDLSFFDAFIHSIYQEYFTRSVYLGGGLSLIVALIVKKKNHVYH